MIKEITLNSWTVGGKVSRMHERTNKLIVNNDRAYISDRLQFTMRNDGNDAKESRGKLKEMFTIGMEMCGVEMKLEREGWR
jgi:hypothetical protein